MKKAFFIALITTIALSARSQQKAVRPFFIEKVSAEDIKALIDTAATATIVNFWASWCGPCTREILWFDSIIEKKNVSVRLLLVSLDFAVDYPRKLAAFVQKQRYKGEVLFLNETSRRLSPRIIDKNWTGEIPASIFINNQKKYYRLYNQQLPPKRFEIELEKLLQ